MPRYLLSLSDKFFVNKGLPDTFDEFVHNANREEVLERVEQKYDEEVREVAEQLYGSEIPAVDADRQLDWLESRFYKHIESFREERFQTPVLNDVYSSVLPRSIESEDTIISTFDYVQDFNGYDAVVLDHCVAFQILEKSTFQYYSEGRRYQDWTEAMEILDEAAQSTEVYVPADLTEKTDRIEFLGQIEGAKILTEDFNTMEIDRDVEVPEGLEHMEEDFGIGSSAADLGDCVMVLSYDGHFFKTISKHHPIDVFTPTRKNH